MESSYIIHLFIYYHFKGARVHFIYVTPAHYEGTGLLHTLLRQQTRVYAAACMDDDLSAAGAAFSHKQCFYCTSIFEPLGVHICPKYERNALKLGIYMR